MEQAERGMLPAHQRLDGSDPPRCQLHLRLVVHDQLLGLERTTQISDEHDWSRSPSSCSNLSPASWPSVSLISLKRSRSINRTAYDVFVRSDRFKPCATRSWKRVRFGSPVSASWSAWWRSFASASLRSMNCASWLAMT